MPTYEYQCKQCKKQFKVFSRTCLKGDEKVECPYCENRDVERLFSSFSLGGYRDSFGSGCGSTSGFG